MSGLLLERPSKPPRPLLTPGLSGSLAESSERSGNNLRAPLTPKNPPKPSDRHLTTRLQLDRRPKDPLRP
ncbi:hypothetical protein PGTUg99_021729 [Puccinia graminis f. sp. tritici]|uniref:Uncharacterized protein n=1 Tax=Puccinia graminis f. sp. tritici TaxID=56615 RepID=A0A5B0S6Q2_PUCGR|nr:hypothetical protein PGTUg99_021729 [Puccinia graminis f. sp. tritici]